MKRILTIAGMLTLLIAPAALFAQDKKVEKVEKEFRVESDKDMKTIKDKRQTEEIIIRKNGDKEINLKVEINGDDIKVNGKPLSEFIDKDVTIDKRKIIIGKGDKRMTWNFDPEDAESLGRNFNEDFSRNFHLETDDNEKDGAFLGVTTEESDKAAKITDVVKGSAAEKAGLQKNDIITKVGDDEISGPESLSDVVGFKKPKEEVKITYKRNGKLATTKAILGERKNKRTYSFSGPRGQFRTFTLPAQPPMTGLNSEGNFNFDGPAFAEGFENYFPRQKKIGLKLQDTEDGNGVKVINVEDSSTAAIAGLKKDDIITEINEKKIDNTDDAREELVPEEGRKSYKIKALRNGSEMTFDVKVPRKLKTANF